MADTHYGRSYTQGPNIGIEIDSWAADVTLAFLREVTAEVKRGALTDQLMDTAFSIAANKFDAYAAAKGKHGDPNEPDWGGSGPLSHVFEWGNPGIPLYHLRMVGVGKSRTVAYTFRESREDVPVPDVMEELYKRRHVYTHKADFLEQGKWLKINPRWSKVMVFYRPGYNASRSTENPESERGQSDIVFKKSESNIYKAGGGKFQNKFKNAFFYWWTRGMGGSNGELGKATKMLSESFVFEAEREVHELARLKAARKTSRDMDATPLARKRAKARAKSINIAMKGKEQKVRP